MLEPKRGDLNLFNQSASGALVHFGWTKCITTMPSIPLGSTAPDNSGPIGWAKKICKPE